METPRIGVLVICHGPLGDALLESAAMLVGPQERVWAVGFYPGEGPEDLDLKVRAALERLEPVDGVLCLVDIPGGVPARVAGALTAGDACASRGLVPEGGTARAVETVSGVNLPMLAEALLRRGGSELPALAEFAVRAGRDGVVDLGAVVRAADARAAARSARP